MASFTQQLGVIKCPPIPTTRIGGSSKKIIQSYSYKKQLRVVCQAAAVVGNAQTRERQKLKEMFEEAYERCRTAPMEGVSFTLEDFHAALDKYDFDSEIGTKVSS